MGLVRKISEYREKQILAHADELRGDEEVFVWVRAKRVRGRGDGFVYLTPSSLIVHLSGPGADTTAVKWDEIDAWGIITGPDAGPILAVETAEGSNLVRLEVTTNRMAEDVATFVEKFAQLAPEPKRDVREGHDLGVVETEGRVDIKREKKNLGSHTRRVVITLVGMGLIVIAALIGFFPGPWSIPLVIAGLAVLAREYDWAKDLLDWFKEKQKDIAAWFKAKRRAIMNWFRARGRSELNDD